MRRLLLTAVLVACLVAAVALPGQRADGRISTPSDVAGVIRVLPRITEAQAATPHRAPLRFTIVDVAGAVVRAHPGGRVLGTIADTTPLGSHSWAWAFTTTRDHAWAKVGLTWQPNGRTGWIRLGHRARIHTAYWVDADLSRRTLSLMRGRHRLVVFRAGIGAPASPTPTGHFYVTDRVATGDPSGPFGWFAFGLSGHQPNLPPGWSGGNQLAIHGTNAPSTIGAAASAGCLHVTSAALATLKRHLRLGSPVVIHR